MATPVTAVTNLNAELEQKLAQNTVAALAGNQAPAPAANNNDIVTISEAAQQAGAATPAVAQNPGPQPTYLQILTLSQQGLTLAEIAQQLGISLQAVETYLGPPPAPGATTNTLA